MCSPISIVSTLWKPSTSSETSELKIMQYNNIIDSQWSAMDGGFELDWKFM
ncbi:hypothetical protein AAG906_007081 [Vitis piasezkii]